MTVSFKKLCSHSDSLKKCFANHSELDVHIITISQLSLRYVIALIASSSQDLVEGYKIGQF